MAEEVKTEQASAQPAPSKPVTSTTVKTAPVKETKVKVVLIGAGSFSGLGLHHILKGQEIMVDATTANKLAIMGLFKKI